MLPDHEFNARSPHEYQPLERLKEKTKGRIIDKEPGNGFAETEPTFEDTNRDPPLRTQLHELLPGVVRLDFMTDSYRRRRSFLFALVGLGFGLALKQEFSGVAHPPLRTPSIPFWLSSWVGEGLLPDRWPGSQNRRQGLRLCVLVAFWKVVSSKRRSRLGVVGIRTQAP